MQANYNFKNVDEVEKFKEDVQAYILKQDLSAIKVLKATQGISAIVDKDIAPLVAAHRWYGNVNEGGVYAVTDIDGKRQYLQNFVWENKTGKKEKHITFQNKLTVDCRFENLIGSSRRAVMYHRRGKSGTTSKFKGVCFEPINETWRVAVQVKGLRYTFGNYKNERKAAMVYDAGARFLMGKLAYQNFPESNATREADKIAKRYITARKARIKKKMEEKVKKNKLKEEKDISSKTN